MFQYCWDKWYVDNGSLLMFVVFFLFGSEIFVCWWNLLYGKNEYWFISYWKLGLNFKIKIRFGKEENWHIYFKNYISGSIICSTHSIF